MTTEPILFTPYRMGPFQLPHRIIMPPMTRSRSDSPGNVPNRLMATYYAQRASAAFIVTEGTQISQQGQGYAWTPGIHSAAQVAGWRLTTQAVHAAGGRIFLQLWHVGRISHTSLQPGGKAPVSSSERVAEGVKVYIDPDGKGPTSGVGGMVQHSKPHALTVAEIAAVVQDFKHAAENAKAAGFDGVEIHSANGYLVNQFIDTSVNDRTDAYGGALAHRLRFLREVTAAVIGVWGRDRVGVRLSPLTTLAGSIDDNPQATYLGAAKLLDTLGVLYVHIAEADWEDAPFMPPAFKEALRMIYGGTLIYAGKYTRGRAEQALENGWADLIGFGRPFVANPDLPERLRRGLPLNPPQREHFFGGGAAGYTDYPRANQEMTPA
jgi:N-ethylmaleimide reductase